MKVLEKKEGTEANRRVEHFITLLRARGHEQLLPRIVREFERAIARARRTREVVLAVGRDADRGKFVDKAKEILAKAGHEGAEIVERVDEKLVRGFSLEGKDFQYDASARRKLLALYETLTA